MHQGDLSSIHLVLELTGDRLINVQKRDGSTALHIAGTLEQRHEGLHASL